MSNSNKRIAIVGCGTAGLTVANLLHRNGIDFTIYDKQTDFDKAAPGHGFIIAPEGLEVLSKIISIDELIANGNVLNQYECYDHAGKLLYTKPLENIFAITRLELLKKLMEPIPAAKIKLGKEFKNIHDEALKEKDIVVVADGINSTLRKNLYPKSHLKPVRENEIINTVESPTLAWQLGNTFRKFHHKEGGLSLGMLKVNRTKVIWYVQFDAKKYAAEVTSDPNAIHNFIKKYFSHWCYPVPSLISNTDFSKSHWWRVFELVGLDSYYKDKFILIGDAAHPVIPLTSQGVALAVKDARLFSNLLVKNMDAYNINTIFESYVQLRKVDILEKIRSGKDMLRNFLKPISLGAANQVPILTK